MGAADFAWANALRRAHFPPERNVLEAHITLFHHLPPSCVDELRQEVRRVTSRPPPESCCDRLIPLGRGVAVHVRSDGLQNVRADLARRFEPLLTPQDRPRPRLHITIQNKASPDLARKTMALLERDFRPRPLQITGLALWYYRGGPWDRIGKYAFRGH